MNKSVCDKQINKELPLLQSLNSNDYMHYKISRPIATKANDKNDAPLDYKNISLTLTGEISSPCIHRSNIMQKRADTSFVDNMEEDDEQFFLNIKKNIDKSNKMQNKENYNIRDLQTKSYLSRKKKSVFNEEDQSLMKRFKRSVDEKKTPYTAPQNLQRSEDVTSVTDRNCSIKAASCSTLNITPAVAFNNIDANLKNNTKECLSHTFSKIQNNNHVITPANTAIINEIEMELIYCEMQYFTPPERKD